MTNTHGGARPGAGRKPKAEKFATEIATAEKRIADRLPFIQDTLEKLAEGGYEKRTRKMLPAALVMKKVVHIDDNGVPHSVEEQAYPDEKDAKKMICVEMTTETLAPDRAANVYLFDRILGKPTQAVELSGPDGEAIDVTSVAMTEAAKELDLWRKKMTAELENSQNAPPT